MGEIGIPPVDFLMMIGLSMDGTPPPSTDDDNVEFVTSCLGPQLVEYYKGTKGVLTSWFEKNYKWATNESTETEIDYSTHAFLIYMLTRSIFYRKSDRVFF